MQTTEKSLNFVVGQKSYAMPLLKVREVIALPKITSVPNPPHHVAGLINLRGQIITVFDLRSYLKIQKLQESPTVIIADMQFGQIGLIVDSVSSVMSIDQKKLEKVPPGSTNSDKSFITNVYSDGDQMILLLDVEQIMNQEIKTLTSRNSAQVA